MVSTSAVQVYLIVCHVVSWRNYGKAKNQKLRGTDSRKKKSKKISWHCPFKLRTRSWATHVFFPSVHRESGPASGQVCAWLHWLPPRVFCFLPFQTTKYSITPTMPHRFRFGMVIHSSTVQYSVRIYRPGFRENKHIEKERFRLVFAKTGSINSGTVQYRCAPPVMKTA